MLDSLVQIDEDEGTDTEPNSPMDVSPALPANPFLGPQDPDEAALEAKEAYKYILAKSYFDTREYDRCAAVFLPPSMSSIPLAPRAPSTSKSKTPLQSQKGKEPTTLFGSKNNNSSSSSQNPFPVLSQKSLFLALYAKYLAGEKRKDEETEMVLGPADGGMTVNKELPGLAQGLEGWFSDRQEKGLENTGQGWLEYLYGVVLLKAKNEEEAKKWLIRSVHLYPFHWGAWQELNDLLASTDDVCSLKSTLQSPSAVANCISYQLKRVVDDLPQNIMTLVFHLYSSQELYQATEHTHQILSELESVFPSSTFLKTQRALLYYHSKGMTI